MRFQINKRELMSAGLLMAIGVATAVAGGNYTIGTLARMGPGFYPTALGLLLILLSLLMVFTPVSVEDRLAEEKHPAPEYRAWACVTLGVIAFIVLGSYGGLVPGTMSLVLISALGDQRNTLKSALALAAGVTVLAVLLFKLLLEMQIPLFTWI